MKVNGIVNYVGELLAVLVDLVFNGFQKQNQWFLKTKPQLLSLHEFRGQLKRTEGKVNFFGVLILKTFIRFLITMCSVSRIYL